jgi:hypothetical protein
MNEKQLSFFAKMIATALKGGDDTKVAELYSKATATASFEDAAKLEELIAANM